MAEVQYSTTAKLAVDDIWQFVRDMDNWANFVRGYQSHEKQSDDDSEWVLKGDLGSLTRTLKFRVHISEWAGPERVTFQIEGVNEQMTGAGKFLMEPYEDETSAVAKAATDGPGFFARVLEALARFFFRRTTGGDMQRRDAANTGPGAGMARLTFELEISPGGPMAPMINAMVKPALVVAAEDLACRIIETLESTQGDPV